MPTSLASLLLAVGLSAFMGVRSLRHRSLSRSGALAAGLVGLSTFSNPHLLTSVVLLTFFVSSSKLTKYQGTRKQALDAHFTEGGQRDVWQVLSNGLTGSVLSLLAMATSRVHPRATLTLMYVAHYAACNGDTWASELGTLHPHWPRLITTGSSVPPGTNGGISTTGLAASLAGGAVVGLAAAFAHLFQSGYYALLSTTAPVGFPADLTTLSLVGVGAAAGLGGSLLDSILGALLQCSYVTAEGKVSNRRQRPEDKLVTGRDVLTNNQVNFLSSLSIALITGLLAFHGHTG
ncbi:hypothetical protein IWQ60_003281 [Tieghemiomyces parasiticus]|uniref:Transmembrane protein 19 n=1 Tax=Tieghemiomyces parasiticus TaxID=78921 RepID=A0A9W8AD58_9FUNG|nr:hypothetical protein IWQ60_003281 [Tieghemiomyces parasiticus]